MKNYPIGSMYGIFPYIYPKDKPNDQMYVNIIATSAEVTPKGSLVRES